MFFNELVKFGKFKGQPLKTLLQDKKYLNNFFLKNTELIEENPSIILGILAQKYSQNISALEKINGEMDIKPNWNKEINQMQIEFLDDSYKLKLAKYILRVPKPKESNNFRVSELQFEMNNCHISFSYHENVKAENQEKKYHFRIWLMYEINENYREILRSFNKLIDEQNNQNTLNVILTKNIDVISVFEDDLKQLFLIQKIFLLKEEYFLDNHFEEKDGEIVEVTTKSINNIITLGSRMKDEDIPF